MDAPTDILTNTVGGEGKYPCDLKPATSTHVGIRASAYHRRPVLITSRVHANEQPKLTHGTPVRLPRTGSPALRARPGLMGRPS